MFHVGDFFTEVSAALIVALLTALVLFLYKLPAALKELKDFMAESKKDMEESRLQHEEHAERLSVHDSLWSSHYNRPVNSRLIAKGEMDFPRAKKPHREN